MIVAKQRFNSLGKKIGSSSSAVALAGIAMFGTAVLPEAAQAAPPTVTLSADNGNDYEMLEDGSGKQIKFAADFQTACGTGECTLQVSGIGSGWSVNPGSGSYDSGTGVWTRVLAAGVITVNNTGPLLTPPANDDGDLALTITATRGVEQTVVASDLIVDAVADTPSAGTNPANGTAGQAIPLDMTAALGADLDGSESLVILVSNLPTGATLSAGVDLGGGAWELTQGDLAGLTLTAPDAGSFDLDVDVISEETPTDGETNLGNNEALASTTLSLIVTAADVCPPAPAMGCFEAQKGSVQLKDSVDNEKDLAAVKWQKGEAVGFGAFGDPRLSTVYNLCVYDDSGLAFEAAVPAGAAPDNQSPGWKQLGRDSNPTGFSYKDKTAAHDGVTTVKLKAGVDGKSSFMLKAKGVGMSLPGPIGGDNYLDQGAGVTVQLRNSEGECWSAKFVGTPKINDGSSVATPQYKNTCSLSSTGTPCQP